ncbi:ATP-binding cassette domain-containing protein [Psychromicrobium xiongbiense]|uniref:ATP-binding cassette domain-containing protein n=1 Tax=Psychromicrobium xiongbiense TaxID=3051184 RepID=UPI002557C694|nr:ABC transporter ATP-binding protein [Psychromicrobium sp. YIM S02556]
MSERLLQVSNLSIRTASPRGQKTLVEDVSLELASGERLGLIGESGSGKSLTAHSILGLLPRSLKASGTVRLAGTDILASRDRDLNAVRGTVASAVFQEPLTALDPLMRVGKQLAWPIARHQGLRGAALQAAVLEALTEVQLPAPERIAASYIHQISGGQRQRVAIAMALACKPQLLIADEPTTALDVTVQAGILDLLDEAVRERSMAMIFISHDLAVVSRVAQKVVVMEAGRVVEHGLVSEVLNHPQHLYTQALVANSRRLESYLPPLEEAR